MPKINTNGTKTLPEDLHLGANMTGDAVQVSQHSQPFFLAEILVPYFGFLLLPSFLSLEYPSQAVVWQY